MREDWIQKNLGKICFTTSGGTPSRKVSEYYDGTIPWVKSGELNHNFILDTEEHVSEEAIKNSSAKIFPKGTLLIALYGATIGKLAILGVPAATNQAICGIFKNGLFETKFLFNYLFHKRQKLIKQGAGGAQPNISQTILKKLAIPVAPLPEQRAIVAKIEQLFSELDNGISNLKTAKNKLEIYRQAVLKKAFEGELTKAWREKQTNLPTADELLEQIKEKRLKHYENQLSEWEEAIAKWEANGQQGKKVSKPRKPKFSEEVKFEEVKVDVIPASWSLTEIQNISDLVTDGTHHTPVYIDDGIKFISVKDIYDEVVHFDNCKYISKEAHAELIKRCHPQKGDLLITKSGTIGRLAIVPNEEFSLFVSVALIKLQSAKNYLHPKWVYYSVKFHVAGLNISQDIKGGLLKNYHLEDLRVAKIILAPFKEQEKVVEEIESRLSVCENILDNIEEGLEKSEALRQSILKQAFEGKLLSRAELEACKNEPDWEPAEQLLERIKNGEQVKPKT